MGARFLKVWESIYKSAREKGWNESYGAGLELEMALWTHLQYTHRDS